MTSHLDRIAYISIPQEFEKSFGKFTIDSSILLPIELPENQDAVPIGQLSWEMIVAAMLKVLAWDNTHENTEYFRRFIMAIRPEVELELSQAALSKMTSHEYGIAEEIFRALVGLSPSTPRHVLNLAIVFDQRARSFSHMDKTELADDYNDLALQWFRNALALDEVLPEAYLYAGYFYMRVHEPARALDLLQSFLQVAPNHESRDEALRAIDELTKNQSEDTLFKEAFDYIKLGKENEGLAKIDSFIYKHKDVWNAHFIRGWALRRLGRFEEGVAAFSEAIKLGGLNSDSLNELAICLMELEKFKEAKKALIEAFNLEPENVKIISNLGILSIKVGNLDEARGFFRTVLDINPDDTIATEYLKEI